MAERFLSPRVAGVDFKIGTQSYSTVFTEQEFESNTGQIDVTTFSNEPESAYEEGQTVHSFRFAGLLKDGSTAADPIMPASNQGVAITQQFGGTGTTANTMTFTGNCSRLLIRRTAKSPGILAGEGIATSAVVKTWKTS
jgi:hypothetical protein